MLKAELEKSEPLLLPKSHASRRKPTIADRKNSPRLNGADLYVARLGRPKNMEGCKKKKANVQSNIVPAVSLAENSETVPLSTTSRSSSISTSSCSLHDELIDKGPPTTPFTECNPDEDADQDRIRDSRPCYRCISYMDSVGIKRVFWTNDTGQWEGGKVRDLVDALDNSMDNAATGGPLGIGVFVTKHEVLMLKRVMGQ